MAPTESQLHFDWNEIERERYDPRVLFDHPNLDDFLGRREGQYFDRKSGRIDPRGLAKTISSFSNADARGGLIVVGIRNRKPEGVDDVGGRLNELMRAPRELCPQATCHLKVVDLSGVCMLLIHVEYNPYRVVDVSDGTVYLRCGDSDRQLPPDEVVRLRQDKGEMPFELEVVEGADMDDLDPDLISEYADSVRRSHRLEYDTSDWDVLLQRRLIRRERGRLRVQMAALLLFGKDPIRYLPGCKVRFIRYEGTEERTGQELNVVKDALLEGPVPRHIKLAADMAFSQLREFQALQPDGRFSVVPEYPPDCVYEAIVNACVHRSFAATTQNVFVRMFDDRLEVESPGGFMPPVTPENIYEQHVPRNPILMDALQNLRFVRCANEGTRRMRKLMEQSGLPLPRFKQESDRMSKVVVTLRNNIEQRKAWIDRDLTRHVGETLARSLSSNEKRVLNYLAEFGSITVSHAHRIANLKTWHAARKLLHGLVAKGLISEIKSKTRDPKAHFVLSESWRPNGGREPGSSHRRPR
jgi:ATP-dependent DNA helicase RecG